MGTTAEKLTYLNDTKQLLKENINSLGGNLTTEPFRQYASVLEGIYERIPKVSGIGTNLSLSPTMAGKIKLNEIQGDTLQENTPTPDTPVEIQSVTGLQNIEVCGKNLFDKDNYNVVNLNPTTTFQYGWRYSTIYIPCKSNTTYTVSREVLENNFAVASCPEVPATGGTVTNKATDNTATSITYTTGASDKYLCVYCRYDGDSSYTLAQIVDSMMIEQGTTASEYEEYKSNTYEVNLGKNLFDKDNVNANKRVNSNDGTIGNMNGISCSDYIDINGAKSLYLSGNTTSQNLTSYQCAFYNSSKTFISGIATTINAVMNNRQIDVPNNAKYIIFNFVNADKNKMQIEKGYSSTSYSPYFTPIELNKTNDNVYQDSIKKSTGKNLFSSEMEQGVIDTNNGLPASSTTRIRSKDFVEVKPSTQYTLSVKESNMQVFIYNYASNGTYLRRTPSSWQNIPYTFTTDNDVYKIKIIIQKSNGANITPEEVSNIMLEQNNQATSYEPYGKVWYVEKQTGRYNTDTSQIILKDTYTNVEYAQIPKVSDYIGYNAWGAQTYLCSHAQWSVNASNWDSVDNIGKIYSGATLLYWWIGFAKGTGLTTIQEKIDGSYIIYPLATPTYTEITNTTLIEQLEALYTAKSKEGTTNISITSEDLEMILNVSALKGDVE